MKLFLRKLLLIQALLLIFQNGFSQVPVLNSDVNSPATIFLDFDGQYVTGTSWNWSGPIAAAPANLNADAIIEIFNRVAEDYRPFTVNITTDSTRYLKAPVNQRMRMIVTPTSAWYGRAGGVSFVGSFSWGDDTPGWVFCELLGNKPKYVAEACSHEAGHTLGLQHQSVYDGNCVKTSEYNAGTGDGEIGWAPIMGVGYYQNLTTWHTGPSSDGCDIIQNDLAVITSAANGIGFKTDDYSDNPITSTPIAIQGAAFNVNGEISKSQDVDAFKLVLDKQNSFRLSAIPNNVGNGNLGADVDLKIFILNSAFDTIGTYNPSRLLDAIIDTSLNKGTYYISIAATGNAYHSDYGSLGNYSLAGTLQSILPIHEFTLKAYDEKAVRQLSWTYTSDEKVESILIESSADGRIFKPLSAVSVGQNSYNFSSPGTSVYYRMRAITYLTHETYYSNIINIEGKLATKNAKALGNIISNSLKVSSNANCTYQVVDAGGARLSAGKLQAGLNLIDAARFPKGLVFLQMSDGRESWTEKLMKE